MVLNNAFHADFKAVILITYTTDIAKLVTILYSSTRYYLMECLLCVLDKVTSFVRILRLPCHGNFICSIVPNTYYTTVIN